MTNRDRIGIFGGTFDPVHIGHLVAAQNAMHECRLDRVILMVAGEPWQKHERQITDAEMRLAAVQAAVAGRSEFEVSRMEVDRIGPTYTAETLRELRRERPTADLFLILGSDAASKVPTWREPEAVAELAQLVIVQRSGQGGSDLDVGLGAWNPIWVSMPALDISSTDLRQRVSEGRPADFLIPEQALEIVRAGWGYNRS